MANELNERYKSNKKYFKYALCIFIILLTIGIISFIGYKFILYEIKLGYTPESIEKDQFDDSEIEQINEFLDFKFDKSQVNRMTFYHARESVFKIFVSDFDSSLVEGNKVGYVNPSYIVTPNSSEYVDGKEYECGRDNLSCFIYEESGETKAMFIYRDWDADLYELVKS